MLSLKIDRNRFVALAALLGVVSMTMLLSLEACGSQGKELQSPSPKPKQVVSRTGVPVGITVVLPRELKNADRDPAILKESSVVVSIPSKDELYVGSERIPKDDSDSRLRAKVNELLKRQAETSKTFTSPAQCLFITELL